jgi:Fe-S-cluster containining protein
MPSADSNPLCLECGLCCNGVIFADGQLQRDDDVARLQSLGLRIGTKQKSKAVRPKFLQPCGALDGCHCRIYPDRPKYCREFECLLLKHLKAGRMKTEAARRVILGARGQADNVRQLLRELGDEEEQTALSLRFQRMKRRLEANLPDEETADTFGRLTLAVHELNLLLSDAFYPGTRC